MKMYFDIYSTSRWIFASLLFLIPAANAQERNAGALTTYSTQVVPLVIVGEGWSQRIVIQNVDSDTPAIGTLSFYTKDGDPWQVTLRDKGTESVFLLNLSPGQTAIFETVVSDAPQTLGWGLVDLTTQGLGDIFGQVVFRKSAEGRPDFMTSHVLGKQGFRSTTTFFDNTSGNYTGMAILTSETCNYSFCQDETNELIVTVSDLDGNVITRKTITQGYGMLYWMNLGLDFPETNGRIGTFNVRVKESYSINLSAFSLQFAGNGAFTAITPFED